MPDPLPSVTPSEGEITKSVFHTVTSPWMQSAVVQPPSEPPPYVGPDADADADANPAASRDEKGNPIFSIGGAIVKDSRKEHLREAERQLKLEREKEQDRVNDTLETERFNLCRHYFVVGCFGLPLLLFINVIHFWGEFNTVSGSFRIRKYLWLSLIVALVELFLWILWFTTLQILNNDVIEKLSIFNSKIPIGFLV